MKKSDYSLAKNDFAKSIDRSMKKKRDTLIVLLLILGLIIAATVFVGVELAHYNRVERVKAVLSQLDIQTTFKEPEFKDMEDWDGDGVPNMRETASGTGVQNEDTDGDGIIDGDEVELGTDPLKEDTDGDGMLDGYEIMSGTNPRVSRTDGETNDADRIMTVKKKDNNCTVTLTGNPNIAGSTVEELELVGISSNASVVSKAYDFYTEYPYESAEISIKIDKDRLFRSGYGYEDLTVLRFDADSLVYNKVESETDVSGQCVKARINRNGTYVVGAEASVNEPATTRVAFLIDNSGSMYPKEKCPTSSENDVDFKRLDFTQSLINKFDTDYKIGISKFTGTYTKMCDFTGDRSELSSILRRIKTEDEIFDGTHNQTALRNCINEFVTEGNGKYRNILVMLSDGESDEVGGATIEELAELANDKSVIVLTVGLGRDIDRDWLQNVAYSTGGKYYSASDANALDDVYKQIVTTLNYDIVSYKDSNDKVTGYSLYNTGFEPSRNGFSFKNFRTTTSSSVDFGMAVMARDWYLGSVSLSLDSITPGDDSDLKVVASGYDLNGTETGGLYEERKTLSELKPQIFSHKYANVREYIDYSSKNGLLTVNKNYRYDAENRGWQVDKRKLEASNLPWDQVELLDLDIAGALDKIARGYSEDDAQLCAALYRLNALQWDDSEEEFSLTGGDEGFERLESLLSLGIPVVTTVDDTHSVNTIGMIRDSGCHRKFILRVYDNNYPDKIKEIYIEKKPVAKLEIEGDKAEVVGEAFTYLAIYEGKQVGLSFSDVYER